MPGSTRRRLPWLMAHTVNRVTTRVAQSSHGPFSLVRHVGRRSGRTYETPVILAKVPDGFVAELTFGEDVNWYRNIVAAGGCIIIHHRKQYRIDAIEPCDASVGRAAYPLPLRTILKILGRTDFRLLRGNTAGPPGRRLLAGR